MSEEGAKRVCLFSAGVGLIFLVWFLFEVRIECLPELALLAWVKFALAVIFGLMLSLAAFLPEVPGADS